MFNNLIITTYWLVDKKSNNFIPGILDFSSEKWGWDYSYESYNQHISPMIDPFQFSVRTLKRRKSISNQIRLVNRPLKSSKHPWGKKCNMHLNVYNF